MNSTCRLSFYALLTTLVSAGAATKLDLSPARISKALLDDHVLQQGRTVLKIDHLCDLWLDHKVYPVIDLVEGLETAQSPRAVHRVVLLHHDLSLARVLPYDPPARPIACKGANLTFSANVEIDNTLPEGRTVSFANGAADATVVSP